MCKAKIIRMTGFFGIVFASLFLLQSPLFVQDSSAATLQCDNVHSYSRDNPHVIPLSKCPGYTSSVLDDNKPWYYILSFTFSGATGWTSTTNYCFGLETVSGTCIAYGNPTIQGRLILGIANVRLSSSTYSRSFDNIILSDNSVPSSGNNYHFNRIILGTSTAYLEFSAFNVIITDDAPFSSPSGSLSITENGTFDVTNYAEAVVDVPSSGGSNYHQDLVDLKQAIYTGVAVLLVIYFFWMIYRIIIINTRR